MSEAIIVHNENIGTDGGQLGAAVNTWYRRKLTANPINEDGIVVSIDTSAGNYAFTLGEGTYRIEAEMSFYISYTFSASSDNATAIAVFFNDTDGTIIAPFSPTYQSDVASSLAGTGAPSGTIPVGRAVTLSCLSIFSVTGSAKTFSFRAAGTGSETWVANGNACGKDHALTTAILGGAQVGNQYLVAKIVRKNTTS